MHLQTCFICKHSIYSLKCLKVMIKKKKKEIQRVRDREKRGREHARLLLYRWPNLSPSGGDSSSSSSSSSSSIEKN